jgi:putative protease
VHGDGIVIEPESALSLSPLKAGDGLVFDAADWRSPEEREEGGRVYQVIPLAGSRLRLQFANNAVDFARVRTGDWVWRSDDPEIDKVCRPFTNARTPVHKQQVYVSVTARAGEALVLEWSIGPADQARVRTQVRSDLALSPSRKHPATLESIRDQLGRLGNTPYTLAGVEGIIEDNPFVPTSLLNELRRRAVAQLEELQSRRPGALVNDAAGLLHDAIGKSKASSDSGEHGPQLHLLVRNAEQLHAAIDVRPASITLDYLDLYGLRPAVERVQAAGIIARVASPRILKPDEQRIVQFLTGLGCDIVVRSTGLLQALTVSAAEIDASIETNAWIGDFSLNASNLLTAAALLERGLQRLTPTHDLNAAQVAHLARGVGPGKIEVIAFQHLPVFHTEHCVFCRFLSNGTSYEDCGHPCEKHRVALRDANGRAHPVMADVGCRNTVFEAQAQEASQHLQTWSAAGIEHYRLEFVHETAAQVSEVALAFTAALNGTIRPSDLRSRLERRLPQGITEGSLFVPENYLEIPSMT